MIYLMMAMDVRGVIGLNNDLPWYYPEDLKFFKEKTLNKKVLMGRKTFQSIVKRLSKPLPKRQSLVVTRGDFTYKGVEIIHDLDIYFKQKFSEDIFVIGGKEIFDQTIKYADKLYITYVKHLYDGDTFMNIDYSLFNHQIIEETEDLIFVLYERKPL